MMVVVVFVVVVVVVIGAVLCSCFLLSPCSIYCCFLSETFGDASPSLDGACLFIVADGPLSQGSIFRAPQVESGFCGAAGS